MEEQLIQVLVNSGADISGDRKEVPEILNYQQAKNDFRLGCN